MDLSCIILSGDLELFVLGMLPEEEASKIQRLAAIFPEVQSELDRISESLEGVAASASLTPSPGVKESIMSKLRTLKEEEDRIKTSETAFHPLTKVRDENPLTKVTDAEAENDYNEIPVVPMPVTKSGNRSWLAAASVIGLVFSLAAVFYLFNDNKQKQNDLTALTQKLDTLNRTNTDQQQKILAYSETMLMAESKDYKKIELAPLPGKQDALANVLWNTKTKEVFLSDMSLPEAPAGKQYQLWAIVDGKPVDAGLIEDFKYLAQKMKVFEKADAFAISIEQKGGSPVPTEVYMMGKT